MEDDHDSDQVVKVDVSGDEPGDQDKENKKEHDKKIIFIIFVLDLLCLLVLVSPQHLCLQLKIPRLTQHLYLE